ncbi:MAG: acyl--CoA ligase [Proteobacteria bacterium]|nr:acyl--CoA ligase [Pseudomonadota bacterium]
MSNMQKLPLLNSYIDYWTGKKPDQAAMIQHEDGKTISYKTLQSMIDVVAGRLLSMGIKKGDRVATQLILVPEHVMLMFACFKIGAIIAPLDLRLKKEEVVRDVNKIEPKAFFFMGATAVADFREIGQAVRESCPFVEHLVQFTPNPESGDIIQGAISITEMMDGAKNASSEEINHLNKELEKAYSQIDTRTAALIIYTTGTTGPPKPAVLCHENIIVQNQILDRGLGLKDEGGKLGYVTMVNLPPSHVGCVTELLMTTLFQGGTAILLRIFDVEATLEAIQKHKITLLGQIPTQFRLLWAHPNYESYDLSSLRYAAYAGSAGDTPFINKLAQMAPGFGTGIGMTENAGFATFTPPNITVEEMAGQVGRAFPDLAEVTVREPMNEDGSAGKELPTGEIGEICYHPPIVFLGYFNQPDETAKAISKEGILYTGDLGHFKDMGNYKALYLSGRRKFMVKQKGYNVFPNEVEEHIAGLDGVDMVDVIGMRHKVFDEGIFAFVRVKRDAELTVEKVLEHCKLIASYKRPQHVELWSHDMQFPLTRNGKVDKLILEELAEKIIIRLRDEGKWDAE